MEATGVIADLAPYARTRLARLYLTTSVLALSLEGGLDWSPTARVQRGESSTARWGNKKGSGVFSCQNIIALLSTFALEGWLDGLPLRLSNDGILPSLYIITLREWPRLLSTARIERYTCSFQACSFLL
jgi:hypothetical protein